MMSHNLPPTEIENLDYSRFVSLIDERNRCSGGIISVHEVIVNSRINSLSNVLEIGCNTGFTSVNLAYLSGCKVTGIDLNRESIELAKQYAKRNGLEDKVNFQVENAENLSFAGEIFDLVWASNVTSFIRNREVAASEYLRVLKFGGTLSLIPIYYRINPPKGLISEISDAIGNKVEYHTKDFWSELFTRMSKNSNAHLELYYERDFEYLDVKDKIDKFIEIVLDKPHLRDVSEDQKSAILKRAKYFYMLFNENLKYCGYTIFLYQKRREQDEAELFLTKPIKNV